jgi:ribosomal protein S18 acetylase RimI-like enzyme
VSSIRAEQPFCEHHKERKVIIHTATTADFDPWLALALEVEHLFGPMVASPSFRLGLAELVAKGQGFCIRTGDGQPGNRLCGALAVISEHNEIAWLAVDRAHQGRGHARALLDHALGRLDPRRDVLVQTFAPEVEQGLAARHLYLSAGFVDLRPAGPNAAGIPTVFMTRRKSLRC